MTLLLVIVAIVLFLIVAWLQKSLLALGLALWALSTIIEDLLKLLHA